MTTAVSVCVPTTTVTPKIPLLGAASLTVPVKIGFLLFAVCGSTVTVGFDRVHGHRLERRIDCAVFKALSRAVAVTS